MNPLVIETGRLRLRWLDRDDAAFIFELLNDPDWIRFIGDKGVIDLDAARRYIESGPRQMYREHGFGLNRVALKADDTPIGICGLLQRAQLSCPDLGFALLPGFRRMGYAFEAASGILLQAPAMGISRVCACLDRDNRASRELLLKLGFEFESTLPGEADAVKLDLYALALT